MILNIIDGFLLHLPKKQLNYELKRIIKYNMHTIKWS